MFSRVCGYEVFNLEESKKMSLVPKVTLPVYTVIYESHL